MTQGINRFRRDRMKLFEQRFQPSSGMRILDLGGTPPLWSLVSSKPQITLLNRDTSGHAAPPEHITFHEGDALNVPFPDGSFDVVFSNSLIEHLETLENQRRFAAEVRRLAPRYFVQTPNFWFPIEPHYLAPIIHYLPRRVRGWLLPITPWNLLRRPGRAKRERYLREVRLLSRRGMEELFPDAEIVHEKLLGWPKSLIAIKGGESRR